MRYCKINEIYEINITLPPLIYNDLFINKSYCALSINDFRLEFTDLNYSFDLNNFNENYISNLWRNAKRSLKEALNNENKLIKCENKESFLKAYKIINENRISRGFPLKMTFEQVEKTISVVNSDAFILIVDQIEVASAIVFQVTESIVQVIYWGDKPGYSNLKPMNLLPYKIFEYYKKKGIKLVDIGPSTEMGSPNHGLCEFKESIGCDITAKYVFSKKIS